ncbi:MAG: serine/threonine protein kinase [Deltaproteobacteria bacterium]|nr:serine/threonine protein kinase [Deltaproteobacteria bacterium]
MSEAVASVPFGRYQLIRRIARGGMAEIYLAKQQGPGRFERSLVIKRILPHLVNTDNQFITMFLDEAALAAQLSHPHIAQVYDFGNEEGTYFIALELVKGPDLRNVVRTAQKLGLEPPPVELAVKMVAEVAGALDYAHHAKGEDGTELHIVHRDVSPQNVLVSYDGVVKLVDFGIAKAATGSTETEAGVVKGKYAYFAPEQIKRVPLDGRTDEYAAALVLYELLTLQQALPGEGMEAIMAAAEARITPIETLRPDLPQDLVAVMHTALAKDRDERYATCRDFQVALEQLLVGWGISVQPHDIARYLAELESQAGEPLSAAVLAQAQAGHTPSLPAKIETGPRALERPNAPRVGTGPLPAVEPAPAPRRNTGMRAALGPPKPADEAPEPERARRPPPRMAEPAPAPAEEPPPDDPDAMMNAPTAYMPENNPEPEPAPEPPKPRPAKAKTGMRKAIDPEAGNATFIKMDRPAGLDDDDEPTNIQAGRRQRAAAGDDQEDEITARKAPAARQKSSARQPALRQADDTARPGTPAFREAEATPPRGQRAEAASKQKAEKAKEKGGTGFFGTLFGLIIFLGGGAAVVGYLAGLRPADFKDVHNFDQAKAVIAAKVADKPEQPVPSALPKPAETPPAPAQPAAALLPNQPDPKAATPAPDKPAEDAKPKPHKVHPKAEAKAEQPAAPEPEQPAPPSTGMALFHVRPYADVTIDGRSYKRTPFAPVELDQGLHNADFADDSGHKLHREFTIVAGQQVTIDVDMTAGK